MLQLIDYIKLLHTDQVAFQAQVITNPTITLKQGTMVIILSGLFPAPYIEEGFYTMKYKNIVRVK